MERSIEPWQNFSSKNSAKYRFLLQHVANSKEKCPRLKKQKKHTNKKICTPNQILYIGKSKSSLRDGSPNVMICPNGLPPDRAGNAGGRRATATQVSVLFSAFLILVGDCGEIFQHEQNFYEHENLETFCPQVHVLMQVLFFEWSTAVMADSAIRRLFWGPVKQNEKLCKMPSGKSIGCHGTGIVISLVN